MMIGIAIVLISERKKQTAARKVLVEKGELTELEAKKSELLFRWVGNIWLAVTALTLLGGIIAL